MTSGRRCPHRPSERLWIGDGDVATPFRTGSVGRCPFEGFLLGADAGLHEIAQVDAQVANVFRLDLNIRPEPTEHPR